MLFRTGARPKFSRLEQYWQKIFVDVFNKYKTLPGNSGLSNNLHNNLSCLASAAPQADSWWLGHVEPDDVVIADIGGQALDIFLHGPESAHQNGIVKTFSDINFDTQNLKKKKKKKRRRGKSSTH